MSNAREAFQASLKYEVEPRNYQEASRDRRWQDAMAKELQTLEDNKTWTIETIPEGKRLIYCKWIFKIKRKAYQSVKYYKARLVAKGFITQVEGLDFHGTFLCW